MSLFLVSIILVGAVIAPIMSLVCLVAVAPASPHKSVMEHWRQLTSDTTPASSGAGRYAVGRD